MIDLKTEIQNFPQIDLVKLSDNHGELQDNIRNSIMFYNKAVESLKFGSEDIAIIELKKAIQLNQDFHEAMNLLGICYLYINDNDKAGEMFNKVMEFEKNGIKAMQLVNMLNSESIKLSPLSEKSKQTSVRRMDSIQLGPTRKQNQVRKNSKRLLMTGIIIGAILMGLVAGIVNVSGLLNNKGNYAKPVTIYVTPNPDNLSELEEAKKQSDSYKAQLEDANRQITSLNETQANNKKTQVNSVNSEILLEAVNFYLQQKPIQSVDLLLTLQLENLTEKEMALYSKIKPDVFIKASDLSYGQANYSLSRNEFENAALYYEKVILYKVASPTATRATLYNLGKCYMNLGEYEKAKVILTELVTKYPNSGYEFSAKERLKQINVKLNLPMTTLQPSPAVQSTLEPQPTVTP